MNSTNISVGDYQYINGTSAWIGGLVGYLNYGTFNIENYLIG